jgi:hypothetical protein
MGFSLLQGARKKIKLVLKVPATASLPERVAANVGGVGPAPAMVAAAPREGALAAAIAGISQGSTPGQYKHSRQCSSPEGSAAALAEGNEYNAKVETVALTARGELHSGRAMGGCSASAARQYTAGEAVASMSEAEEMLELPQQLGGTMSTLFRSVPQKRQYLRLNFNSESSKHLRRFKGWGILGLEKVSIRNDIVYNICAWCAVVER